ncbi:STAS domain-containing protein [Polyangium mundeleinium]|uniref:PAS domain-containing protein n=1 Tax=Polyangium mundeleinium TaxID=2995306 RepID=A0ABT5EX18_9BACT|nr:STAS domain-containing protein [Polyangium mundeleinium]MDC0746360.1 PAS domain-containing protein [Polyangium mundeleinium]
MSKTQGATAMAVLRAIGENIPGAIMFALDRDYRYIYFNPRHEGVMRAIWGADIRLGLSMLEVIKASADREKARLNFDRALAGEAFTVVEAYGDEALQRNYWENVYAPVRGEDGAAIGVFVQVKDVTTEKRNEALVAEHRAELERMVAARTAELEEKIALIQAISAPIIQVWDGVLVVPLVGTLDERRGERVTDDVLAAIQQFQTREVLLDITGMRSVDESAAHRLLQTISATRLLGAGCAVVGVSPEVARTLVGIDAPLSGVPTYGTLRDGLRAALRRMAFEVVRRRK